MSWTYHAFGLRIRSELEFPDLVADESRDGKTDLTIRLGTVPRRQHKTTLGEELAINRLGAAFWIRNGNEITVDSRPEVDPDTVKVLLLGRIMAFLLRQRGWLPLHASGVCVLDASVLFLGESGVGKSTTAAAFYREGYPIVTDDVAAVRVADGRCLVQSARPHLRLGEEARAVLGLGERAAHFQIDKYCLELGSAPLQDTYPVDCVYVLETGERKSVERVPPLLAAALFSRHSFVKHRKMDRESMACHLRDCAAAAAAVPVYRLVRPRALSALGEVVRLVERDIAERAALTG